MAQKKELSEILSFLKKYLKMTSLADVVDDSGFSRKMAEYAG